MNKQQRQRLAHVEDQNAALRKTLTSISAHRGSLAAQTASLRRQVAVRDQTIADLTARLDTVRAAWQFELRRADRLEAELADWQQQPDAAVVALVPDEPDRFQKAAGG